ncbi:acyl-CoA thioesterase [Dictyobacter alpinus]|uniref:Acyl-CoA thioesterase n=1 Tax=Dictyobacter alpinus TaxID=2014873 RepID=A0A402BF41_9CHLR|nr:acyl-CoA thioester hydrolase/BAAT C-terminal domain-containing protein [Dictyobacter alpinus]GCE29993.1 acyl-CoA thioesterase [Dictyobacter alpinus]
MIEEKKSMPSCQLAVMPQRALVDEPLSMRLAGLQPRQTVTVRTRTQDGSLKTWEAFATFIADEQGTVDVSTQKPVAGTYDTIDPLGLLWSMSCTDAKRPIFFTKTKPTSLLITLTAEVEGTIVASTQIERLFAAPGMRIVPIQERGLIGTLFLPAASGPHSAVIILNGSDGGMREHAAALLASHGYAALALAYFGAEELPAGLLNIPLEYFEKALVWLQAQDDVDEENIAVIGLSRGGELALLLGSTFPAIKAVVAGAPSGIIQSGIKNNTDFSDPAWTRQGQALPYVSYKNTFLSTLDFMWHWLRHKPFTMVTNFRKALTSKKAMVEAATIAVERIQGPILLISGGDDQLWPSTQFSQLIMERLAKYNHPYEYEHLHYEKAGHFVCFPYALPSLPPMIMLSPLAGMYLGFGGTPEANASAAIDSWPKMLTFLASALKQSS